MAPEGDVAPAAHTRLARWLDAVVLDLARQFRWSYLPPLMVYVAAGVSGLTGIVGTFFIKDYLGLSAAFLASLAFWAGIPWVLKMPLGHIVDLMWRWKSLLVYLGAALIAASVAIMYLLIAHPDAMRGAMSAEAWYVLSALLAPVGYVIQDVVADAMTVEAVPLVDATGRRRSEDEIKLGHTTMQTLGRVAIIGGSLLVALVNIVMFAGAGESSPAQNATIYARVYLMALAIPLISVAGVILGDVMLRRRARTLAALGVAPEARGAPPGEELGATRPNWAILWGSLAFVAFTIAMGLADVPAAQEIIFAGSMAIVVFLMLRLMEALAPEQRRALLGTAIIIFVFRATPLPGDGATWWQIDALGFDPQFLSVLTLISALLTLAGLFVFRRAIGTMTIARVVAVLTIAAGALSLPIIGLFYGLHEWTARLTGGVVDARFIAIVNTALESPLSQIAMIPMLAWIAKNAPAELKATFFAVMASFTNLALSASSLGTKYLNDIFVVTREVRDAAGAVITAPDYSALGELLIVVTIISVAAPLLTIAIVQHSPLRTTQ
jgi:hypothetical protein